MVLNNILNITEKNKEKELLFNLGFYLAVLFNALLWLLLFYNFKPTSEQIGLHYNIYFGIDYYGFWYKIFLIPATGALIIAARCGIAPDDSS